MESMHPLYNFRKISKLYEQLTEPIRQKYQLSQTEIDVAGFLYHNPELNSAKHIVEFRNLPKANVSIAVEQLARQGFLTATRDSEDRRLVHLLLTPLSEALTADIVSAQKELEEIFFIGFTSEEKNIYQSMNARIAENVSQAMKGKQNEQK